MEKPRMGKTKRAILIAAAVALALLCAAALAMRQGLTHMREGAVQVAEKPAPTTAPSPALSAAPTHTAAPEAPPAPSPIPIYRVEPIDGEVTNVLLIGTDSRKAAGSLISGNADTTILASFNRRTNTVTLVSFLRDTVLTIGGLSGEYGKLKTAYTTGGTGMLVNTLNEFFALDIQQYCAVGLNGFVAFVDETLGGVDMELSRAEIDYINERITSYENEIDAVKRCPLVTDPPGMVHLTGAQLLIFVRNRTTGADDGDGGNDYDRAARQQEALETIYRKIVAEQPLSAVPGVIGFAMRHVETNMTAEEIYALAVPLMTDPPAIRCVSVPFAGTWEYGGDGTGILFYRETTVERLRALLYADQSTGDVS